MKNPLRIAIISLSLLGMVIMAYLIKVGYSDGGSFCDLSETINCDLVNKSKYAKVFGIPVSFGGFAFFTLLFVTYLRSFTPETIKRNVLLGIFFLVPSYYLTMTEIFDLKAYCIFCETSKVVMLILVVLGIFALRPVRLKKNEVITALVAGLIMAVSMFFIHTNSGPGTKYEEFSKCLAEKEFVMLGSKTCASCLKQRDMFGDPIHNIREVECDPRNVDTSEKQKEVEYCATYKITKTPTWIQLDTEGNLVHRFDAGVQSFESLAEVSGCALPAEK